jgi:hypothetical protein
VSSNLPVKAHAALGASNASRWMMCPGSVRMERGLPDNDSEHSREGTAAHALAERCMTSGVDASTFIGVELEGVQVTEEMADYVQIFIGYVRGLIQETERHWVEQKFSLAELNPPEAMFGTADFVAYDAVSKTLHVVDLKYGRGVVVEVRGNKQLRYYGLGALLALGREIEVDQVVLTIVQPRVLHPDGIIRSETISFTELLDFAGELLDAARRTQEPEAPLVPGPHCRFCKASAFCPAQLELAESIALVEFDEMPTHRPPAPETLPPEVLGEMLTKIPILEDWIKSMYQHAQRRLEAGEPVPGLKLVARRATRKWASETQARQWLEGQGYSPEEILVEPELRSPAQIEKVIGKTGMKEMPEGLVKKESSGNTVALISDPRPAVAILPPGDEFDALPEGGT